jgi:predicted TIM-barrel fold metal-dependent hydrolase
MEQRRLPAGACDSAAHVYDDTERSRLSEARKYQPPAAGLNALLALHDKLGIQRGVLVQPTTYGTDHRLLFDALARTGGRYRGAMLVDDATGAADFEEAHQRGVRAVRFHLWKFLAQPFRRALFDRTVERIAPLGWHVKLHLKGDELVAHESLVRSARVPVVIDHMAHVEHAAGIEAAPRRLLLDLVREEACWVQIANCDRWSAVGAPSYADAIPFMAALLAANPDRCIWGTDWPHILYKRPGALDAPPPDDGDLVAAFLKAAGSDATAERVLVHNPAQLYGWA